VEKLAVLDAFQQKVVFIHTSTGEIEYTIEQVGHADGLQMDKANGYLYWTDMGPNRNGEDFLHPDGAIYRSKLDGSARELLIGNGQICTPKQLQLDPETQYLYWCDREGASICRAKTDGSQLEKLVERNNSPIYPKNIHDQCVGIAIDKDRDHIYWTQKGPKKGGKGRIFRAGLNIPLGENALNRSDILTLLSDLPEPIDLEMDKANRILYWTDRGSEPNGNTLNCANITDDGLMNHRILANGFKEAIGLILGDSYIFVSDLSGCVYRINLDTLEKDVIYSGGEALTGIAIY
jgi:sugar lactone lactonase YvrE